MEFERGLVVAQRYRLDRLLGEGGMGAVWAAVHTITHKRVALKLLKGPVTDDVRRRFLREARAACAVRHPNVVQVHDVVELDDGTPLMIMDLLEGESLAHRLRERGSLPAEEAAAILAPVVSAVACAHGLGVVHRDLKPDNLFLARLGDGPVSVKVLDFGIAKLTATEGVTAETGALTRSGSVLGTPYYMSPEQAFGERDIDGRSDTWALGVLLYECLTGVRPTQGDNLGQVFKAITAGTLPSLLDAAPEVPADIAHLVTRMLARDRKARPDLAEVLAVLERHAGDALTRTSLSSTDTARRGRSVAPSANTPLRWSALGLSARTMGVAPPKNKRAFYMGGAAVVLTALGVVGWVATHASPTAASASSAAETSPPSASSALAPPSTTPQSEPSKTAASTAEPEPSASSPSAVTALTASSPKRLPALSARSAAAIAPPSAVPSVNPRPSVVPTVTGDIVEHPPF